MAITWPRVSFRDEFRQNQATLGLMIGLFTIALIMLHPSIFFYRPNAATSKYLADKWVGKA